MNKLEQAAREVIRQHSMECLSDKSVDALRKALAEQAEQEPVATVVDESEEQTNTMSWILSLPLPVGTKLYAAPARTKDLTDDEIMQTYTNFNLNELGEQSFMIGFAGAVIAKDREKNRAG